MAQVPNTTRKIQKAEGIQNYKMETRAAWSSQSVSGVSMGTHEGSTSTVEEMWPYTYEAEHCYHTMRIIYSEAILAPALLLDHENYLLPFLPPIVGWSDI